MALDLKVKYPTQVDAGNPSYPFGQPRNVSAPAATDGTPWEQALVRDIYGVLQKLLQDAGITPTGNPDSALASQYLDAMELLFLNRSELRSNGGVVLHDGDSLVELSRFNMAPAWVTSVLELTRTGGARNASGTADLLHLTNLQKNPTITWSAGSLGGGLPAALSNTNRWLRRYLVTKPDGTSDIAYDTSVSAANFFVDPAAISAGFSDNTLYRRIGWTYIDASLQIKRYVVDSGDSRRFMWIEPVRDVSTTIIGSGSSTILPLATIPPFGVRGLLNVFVKHSEAADYTVRPFNQGAGAPSASDFSVRLVASPFEANLRGEWPSGSGSIVARRTAAGTVSEFSVISEGWIDDGISV